MIEYSVSGRRYRLPWLDICKGIGIILVVIGHIYYNQIVFNWLYSFHMPLFFVAAGVVYQERPIITDIRRRVQTILIPYLSFGILLLMYWQLVERRFRQSNKSFIESLIGLLTGNYDYLDFNVHLWFLPCFFITVILANILIRTFGKIVAYTIAVVCSALHIIVTMPELPLGLNRVCQYILFYMTGIMLSALLNGFSSCSFANTRCAGLLFALTACLLMVINFVLAYYHLNKSFMWYITAITGVSGVILVSILIHKNRVLEYLGRISLIILCLHGPIYRVIIKMMAVLLRIETSVVRTHIIGVFAVTLLTLIGCSLIYELAARIAPWMIGKSSKKIV